MGVTMAKNNGMTFHQWQASGHYPLRNDSDAVKHFMDGPMREAFEAGALHERRVKAEARKALREDDFTFADAEGGENNTTISLLGTQYKT